MSSSTARAGQGVVVLGGGLAGLAAGMRAGATVFEAADQAGGVAASDQVDGFTFDRGIHILQTRNKKILDLLSQLNVEMVARDRDAHIYSHDTYTAYPFQVNTANLPLGLRARCVRDFLTRKDQDTIQNYEQWMYANLGAGFAETFLIPYSEKFWGVPPREMTHDWTGNRVPKPNALQVIRGALWNKRTPIGSNATFQYPRQGGYGTVPSALASKVADLRFGHRATQVDTESRRVTFGNGHQSSYDVLISTLPLPHLIAMIGPPAPDQVREAASRLRTNSIYVVNIGIDRPRISPRHWVHFPEKEISFFRISYPHNFNDSVVPPGMSAISAEVAYSESRPIDKTTIVETVIADLIRVGAMHKDDPIAVRGTRDIPLAYCIYDHQRKPAVRTATDWLAEQGIISCGRYGLWSYFWSDEAITSGLNAADKALKLAGVA